MLLILNVKISHFSNSKKFPEGPLGQSKKKANLLFSWSNFNFYAREGFVKLCNPSNEIWATLKMKQKFVISDSISKFLTKILFLVRVQGHSQILRCFLNQSKHREIIIHVCGMTLTNKALIIEEKQPPNFPHAILYFFIFWRWNFTVQPKKIEFSSSSFFAWRSKPWKQKVDLYFIGFNIDSSDGPKYLWNKHAM